MKTLKIISVIIILALVVFFLVYNKQENQIEDIAENNSIELCFARIGTVNQNNLYDKYTLRMTLSGENREIVNGELKFLPAEKDSKVGTIVGTASAVDRQAMARTVDAIWDTFGEGINAKEEIRIIFGEGTASLGAGELEQGADGVYRYKDKESLKYTLDLYDIDCAELNERERVDKYIRDNITTLSPVKAVLGGTWYVFSNIINLKENTGTVIYEDGHIQEKRDYTYTLTPEGEVLGVEIKFEQNK